MYFECGGERVRAFSPVPTITYGSGNWMRLAYALRARTPLRRAGYERCERTRECRGASHSVRKRTHVWEAKEEAREKTR
jgi:hypothetical protein